MKILLRSHDGKQYVWKTAKYNNNDFYVDGEQIRENNVVSIINDNRKNYIQCSCCGKTFRRGSRQFEEHKANAIKSETCFGCNHLCVSGINSTTNKYTINPDGTFKQISTRDVVLQCDRTGLWSHYKIDDPRTIDLCKKRQCKDAVETEIIDFFTQYPGAFDDIITIDRLLDEGYDVGVRNQRDSNYDIIMEDYYSIGVRINHLGIVDRFIVYYDGDDYYVYYSKRYNELFYDVGRYVEWWPEDMDEETRIEIKKHIAKLYY